MIRFRFHIYIIYIISVLQQLYVKPILTRYLSLLPLRHEITITTKQGFRKKDFKKLPCKKKLRVQQVNGNPTKRAAKTGTKKGKGRRRRQFPLSVFTYYIYLLTSYSLICFYLLYIYLITLYIYLITLYIYIIIQLK